MAEVLDNGFLRLRIDPDLGACVTRLEAQIGDVWQPVCVSETPTDAPRHASQSALFFMLPFANRARDNLLIGDTQSWEVEPNTDEALALHGMVWIKKWSVNEVSASFVKLSCSVLDGFPYPFDADLMASLEGSTVSFRLTLTARGTEAVPVGMGFHPYFPRLPGTMLAFNAKRRWHEGADYLPTTSTLLTENDAYAAGSPLPSSWQNTCFTGWDGRASIDQPDFGYSVSVQASQGLRALMVYSAPDLDRFAVEPQSHLSGRTTAGGDGLRMIAPNQSWSEEMQLQVNKHY